MDVIGSSPGEPYSESNVAGDRNNILALYYNDGFPDAQVEGQASPASEPNKVNIAFQITEGPRVNVLRVLLTGYEHTRYGVMAREVQVKPGGPLREGDVVESQRRLYNLAIFNRVQIAPQNPDGTDPDKTVVVAVEEGKRYTIGYGLGIEVQRLPGSGSNPTGTSLSASPRVIFEFGKNNVEGRGQSISFKVRASTLQYRAVLSYTAPHFLANPHFNVQLTGYADKTQDVNTFNSERYEGAVQFVDTVSPQTSLLFRYFFRHVIVIASSLKIAPDEIPLFSQPTLISGFGASWARDKRNNAADASKGSYNSVDFSVAGKPIGSSASFLRLFVQNSTFHPFGRSFVFARALRFGVEHQFPDTTPDEIPLPERFFAGGGQSIRGFGLNQAGPRDPTTGFPIGGLALLEFNQELRFPLKLPYVGNRIGGTFFYDAGNVYTDLTHITWRYTPASLTNLNYLSHTVGAGLRYATPIGPVRIDFGYQINPAQFSFTNSTTNAAGDAAIAAFSILFQYRAGVLMRRAFLFLLTLMTALAAGGSALRRVRRRGGAAAQRRRATVTVDGIAARIEGDIVTESQLNELAGFQKLVDGKAGSRADLLRELTDQWIVNTEAQTARFGRPKPEDVTQAFDDSGETISFGGCVSESDRGRGTYGIGGAAATGIADFLSRDSSITNSVLRRR